MTPGKIYSFLQFMWYEKNNLVVRTWILDFSRSIYDEIDIIPWILRLIICCLANNRNLPRARHNRLDTGRGAGLILAELEQLHDHRQRSQQIYSSKHRWRASKKISRNIFFVKQRSPFKFFWVFIVKKRSPLKMHMCQPNAVFCTNIYFIFSIQTFCVEEEEDRLWVE